MAVKYLGTRGTRPSRYGLVGYLIEFIILLVNVKGSGSGVGEKRNADRVGVYVAIGSEKPAKTVRVRELNMESYSITQHIAEDLGGAECANVIHCANAAISGSSKVVVHHKYIATIQ